MLISCLQKLGTPGTLFKIFNNTFNKFYICNKYFILEKLGRKPERYCTPNYDVIPLGTDLFVVTLGSISKMLNHSHILIYW